MSEENKRINLIIDISLMKGLTDAITRTPDEIQEDKENLEKYLCTKELHAQLLDEGRHKTTSLTQIILTGLPAIPGYSLNATKVNV